MNEISIFHVKNVKKKLKILPSKTYSENSENHILEFTFCCIPISESVVEIWRLKVSIMLKIVLRI